MMYWIVQEWSLRRRGLYVEVHKHILEIINILDSSEWSLRTDDFCVEIWSLIQALL